MKACGVLSVASGGNSVQWGGKEGVTYNSIVTECLGSLQQTVCTATALRSERALGDVKHALLNAGFDLFVGSSE